MSDINTAGAAIIEMAQLSLDESKPVIEFVRCKSPQERDEDDNEFDGHYGSDYDEEKNDTGALDDAEAFDDEEVVDYSLRSVVKEKMPKPASSKKIKGQLNRVRKSIIDSMKRKAVFKEKVEKEKKPKTHKPCRPNFRTAERRALATRLCATDEKSVKSAKQALFDWEERMRELRHRTLEGYVPSASESLSLLDADVADNWITKTGGIRRAVQGSSAKTNNTLAAIRSQLQKEENARDFDLQLSKRLMMNETVAKLEAELDANELTNEAHDERIAHLANLLDDEWADRCNEKRTPSRYDYQKSVNPKILSKEKIAFVEGLLRAKRKRC